MRKAIVFSICLLLVFGVALVLRPVSAQQVVTWKMQLRTQLGPPS